MTDIVTHHPVLTALAAVLLVIAIVAMDYSLFCMKRWMHDRKINRPGDDR